MKYRLTGNNVSYCVLSSINSIRYGVCNDSVNWKNILPCFIRWQTVHYWSQLWLTYLICSSKCSVYFEKRDKTWKKFKYSKVYIYTTLRSVVTKTLHKCKFYFVMCITLSPSIWLSILCNTFHLPLQENYHSKNKNCKYVHTITYK